MGSNKAQEISNKLNLNGRIDIYYAFIVCTGDVLKENGIAGYITSNKFLTIKSGSSVRDYILDNYCIHRITDFGDTKLFSASVLPCITVFSKGKTTEADNVKFTSVYQANNVEEFTKINNIFDSIYDAGFLEYLTDVCFIISKEQSKVYEKVRFGILNRMRRRNGLKM